MKELPSPLLAFGLSLLSCGIVSAKVSLWGWAMWKVNVPDNPRVLAAVFVGLFVVPWLAVSLRLLNASMEHAVEMGTASAFGGYLDEDQERERWWERVDGALSASFEWLFSTSAHSFSWGAISGGLSGVSVAVVKIVFSRSHIAVAALCIGATVVLLVWVSSKYWSWMVGKWIAGLSEAVEEFLPSGPGHGMGELWDPEHEDAWLRHLSESEAERTPPVPKKPS